MEESLISALVSLPALTPWLALAPAPAPAAAHMRGQDLDNTYDGDGDGGGDGTRPYIYDRGRRGERGCCSGQVFRKMDYSCCPCQAFGGFCSAFCHVAAAVVDVASCSCAPISLLPLSLFLKFLLLFWVEDRWLVEFSSRWSRRLRDASVRVLQRSFVYTYNANQYRGRNICTLKYFPANYDFSFDGHRESEIGIPYRTLKCV